MVALLVVAIALGLNNFAASIAIGVSGVARRTGIKVAVVFGLWDTVMPATGLLIGHRLAGDLGPAARWTGAGVLAAAGLYGLVEALGDGDDTPQVWHGWRLLISGAALSLDDLAVGFALGALRVPVVIAVILCGSISIAMSMIGLELGGKIGTVTGDRGEVIAAAGLICVAMAMAAGWLLRVAEAGPSSRPSPQCTGQGEAGHDDHNQRGQTADPAQRQEPEQSSATHDGQRRH